MSKHRPLHLAALVVSLATHALGAQGAPPPASLDTFTIVSARANQQVRLTLTGSDVAVTVLGDRSGRISADTLVVSTPVRIEVPRKPFSMVISAATGEAGGIQLVRVLPNSGASAPAYDRILSLPFSMRNFAADSVATIKGDTGTTRIP